MERYGFSPIMESNVTAARQAILSADDKLLGYELLWRRDASTHRAEVVDDYDATMRALFAVGLNIGWSRFFDGALAFVNVDLEFIEKHLYMALPPQACVLEIRPFGELPRHQRIELVHARRLGYRLAWDGVTSSADARMELAQEGDYVKVDVEAASLDQVVELLDLCASRKLQAIVYRVEHEAEFAFFMARGAFGAQGQVLHPAENHSHVQLPAAPVEVLHALRRILTSARPMPERVCAVESCPELLLNLLMLTDVAWQPHWPYPNTVEQLLRGISRGAVIAWLDIMLYQLYREASARRTASAIALLQPAVFGRMVARRLCPTEIELHEEAFLAGFLAQLRCAHPDVLESRDAPIRLGRTLRNTLAARRSILHAVFDYASSVGQAQALDRAPGLLLPPGLEDLVRASRVAAQDILTAGSRVDAERAPGQARRVEEAYAEKSPSGSAQSICSV